MAVPRLVIARLGRRAARSTWYWISRRDLLLGAWLALNLIDSPTGRALRALHDSEVAARVLGVDVARYKLAVFVVSAVYASVAGSLSRAAQRLHHAGRRRLPALDRARRPWWCSAAWARSSAPLVGAAMLRVLPQTLTVLQEYEHMVLGLMMMLFMIFLRAGIVPALASASSARRP